MARCGNRNWRTELLIWYRGRLPGKLHEGVHSFLRLETIWLLQHYVGWSQDKSRPDMKSSTSRLSISSCIMLSVGPATMAQNTFGVCQRRISTWLFLVGPIRKTGSHGSIRRIDSILLTSLLLTSKCLQPMKYLLSCLVIIIILLWLTSRRHRTSRSLWKESLERKELMNSLCQKYKLFLCCKPKLLTEFPRYAINRSVD